MPATIGYFYTRGEGLSQYLLVFWNGKASGAEGHATGRIALSTADNHTGIWSLPIRGNEGKVTGELQRVTGGK